MLHPAKRFPIQQSRRSALPVVSRSASTQARLPALRATQQLGASATVEQQKLRIRYLRRDQNYQGWWLHCWGDVQTPTDWAAPLPPSGWEEGCPYWDLALQPRAHKVGLQIHRGEDKAAAAEVNPQEHGEVWLAGSRHEVFSGRPSLTELPTGDLGKAYGNWVSRSHLIWRTAIADDPGAGGGKRHFQLHYSRGAQLYITGEGVGGADLSIPLEPAAASLPPELKVKYPYLDGSSLLQVPQEHMDKVSNMLQGQLAVSVANAEGVVLDITGVQTAGVLDDLFYTDAPLGDHYDASMGKHVISVWAPTAHIVEVLHWEQLRGGEPAVYGMTRSAQGVWTYVRPAEWKGTCYKFRVVAFCPWSNRIEHMEATDPYSRCTTANGERTLLVDLEDPALMPEGWKEHKPPKVASWHDISVYELHIRDFSAMDDSVPQPLRGKYRAFCPHHVNPAAPQQLSAGLTHLSKMQAAGITHLHLLPSYDYGSVPEREEEQARLQEDLSVHPPDSERQQAAVAAIADNDAFNWGYDPVHYGTPEGSYSTQPDGPMRILEYREMVQSLHALGLNVVCDVVYNHTFAAGPWSHNTVLDKVVPGYYHRRGENGELLHSTCCNNTASEHRMFERFMVDDLRHWATTYKIDGFRFDIMGHHLVTNMTRIRDGLNALTPANSGVDGASIYLYGEAWNFGEMVGNQRGLNAAQLNLGGTRIGAFNDRMRDGAMGGSPYASPDCQGFVTGLALDPNASTSQGPPEQQLDALLNGADWVRYCLAGNLRSYQLQVHTGGVLAGDKAQYYGGQPIAYGLDPCENVLFCGCHDNETIFDQVMMKAPAHLDADGRARMCVFAQSLLVLAQGVPFIHAGDDLLRSKSLDRDSYNSGDWFNRVDWTGQHNNFGVGLPPASKNGHAWPFKRPLLTAADQYRPSPQLIQRSSAYVQALLRVRYSSPLFRMRSADHINKQLFFHNTGPTQDPGVIIMELVSSDSGDAGAYDPQYSRILVVFNGRPAAYQLPQGAFDQRYQLHPALAKLQDPWLVEAAASSQGALQVGARVAAVFVLPRS